MKILNYYIILDIYLNNFETFQTLYYSLDSIYMQLTNTPFELWKQLKNYLIIKLVPFSGKFDDVMRSLLYKLRDLKKGIVMTIEEKNIWVVAGISLVTADLSQGNNLADIKQQGVSYSCKMCMAS